jgi:hypothetical protein
MPSAFVSSYFITPLLHYSITRTLLRLELPENWATYSLWPQLL